MTVFRDDIGEGTSIEDLQALSGKKRNLKLDAIKDACTAYIQGSLQENLRYLIEQTAKRTGLSLQAFRVAPDEEDGQTLLLWCRHPAQTGPHPAGAFRPCGENPEIDRKCRKWASCRAVVCSRPDHVHLTEIVGTTMLSKSLGPPPPPCGGPWIPALAFSCHESRIEGPSVPRLFCQRGGKGGQEARPGSSFSTSIAAFSAGTISPSP